MAFGCLTDVDQILIEKSYQFIYLRELLLGLDKEVIDKSGLVLDMDQFFVIAEHYSHERPAIAQYLILNLISS